MENSKTNEGIQGKVVKELIKVNDSSMRLVFDDESYVEFEIERYNTSCSCHPEYEYELEATFY